MPVPPAAERPGACALASRRSTCEGSAEEERLRSGPFPLGQVSRGRGGAARGSSRGTPKRSGSEAAVLLQRPGGGGGGGGGGCGGDSGRDRRCPRGAAAGSAAARTAAEGPAGRGAEQLRHGKRGWRRRRCSGAFASPFRSGSRPAGTRPSVPRGAGPGGRGSKAWGGSGIPGALSSTFPLLGRFLPGEPSSPSSWLRTEPRTPRAATGQGLLINAPAACLEGLRRQHRGEARGAAGAPSVSQSDLARRRGTRSGLQRG